MPKKRVVLLQAPPNARCPEPRVRSSGSVELRLAFDELEQVSVDQVWVGRKQTV